MKTRADLDLENRRLRSTIDRLESTIERLTQTNSKLADKLANLASEVAALRSELARLRGKSPEIPSGQQPVHLKPSRSKRARPPGGKKGHTGSTRRVPEPDLEEAHKLKRCPQCEGHVRQVRGEPF